MEALLPASYLEKTNQSKVTFYPNSRARVLGSKMLAKYFGPHRLPFNGPELCVRVQSGSGVDSVRAGDQIRMKKMKVQLNEVC